MAEASTRNIEQEVLRAIAERGVGTVAQRIGLDDSSVSRIISGQQGIKLEHLEPFLRSLGMRIITTEAEIVAMPADELEALRVLAMKGLSK